MFTFPIDRKKYRKYAGGLVPFNSISYGYNNIHTLSGLSFDPKLVVLFTANTSMQWIGGGHNIESMEKFVQGATVGGKDSAPSPDGNIRVKVYGTLGAKSFQYMVANVSNPQQTLSFVVGWLAFA